MNLPIFNSLSPAGSASTVGRCHRCGGSALRANLGIHGKSRRVIQRSARGVNP